MEVCHIKLLLLTPAVVFLHRFRKQCQVSGSLLACRAHVCVQQLCVCSSLCCRSECTTNPHYFFSFGPDELKMSVLYVQLSNITIAFSFAAAMLVSVRRLLPMTLARSCIIKLQCHCFACFSKFPTFVNNNFYFAKCLRKINGIDTS